jgi:hypothetical protein
MSQASQTGNSTGLHHAHVSHARSAKYRYHPGMLSFFYQNMSPADRSSIDSEVDEEFRKETGRTTKLDWNQAKDRPEARRWLKMRDFAVLRFYLARQKMRRAECRIAHEKYVSDSVGYYQSHLQVASEQAGLPKAEPQSKGFLGLQTAHIAAEFLDGAGELGLWKLIVSDASVEFVALLGTGASGALAILASMAEMGENHVSGRNVSERNCFRYGFAAKLHAMAIGGDCPGGDSTATIEGQMQFRGRNAAVRMVKEMGAEIGKRFLVRYAGPNGNDVAIRDLGGYETELREK